MDSVPQKDDSFDMSVFDNVGPHVRKRPLLISLWAIFGLSIGSVLARYYVRLRIQRQFSVDDWILLFGVCTLTASMVLLQWFYVDNIYMIQSMQFSDGSLGLPEDWLARIFNYQIVGTTAYALSFLTIASVKFCFLFLFRTLIARIRWLVVYWWIVFVFTILVSCWCVALYAVVCPYYGSIESLKCGTGSYIFKIVDISISGMALDIVSDILILFIPIRIIYTLKIALSQKVALTVSLCLTGILVILTLIRAVTINKGNRIDATWELYMQYLAAEVGVSLTAFTAFRQFFVSRAQARGRQWQLPPTPPVFTSTNEGGDSAGDAGRGREIGGPRLVRRCRNFFCHVLMTPRSWLSGMSSFWGSDGQDKNVKEMVIFHELPRPPRGTMTDVKSWIERQGRSMSGGGSWSLRGGGDGDGSGWEESQATRGTEGTQATMVGDGFDGVNEGGEEVGWPLSNKF